MRLTAAIVLMLVMGCQNATMPEAAATPTRAATTRPADDALVVMTFNLRYASIKPPNAWWQRREAMRDCIRGVNPDVFGTQEGLYGQLRDIDADLGDYAWIGTGRDGG